MSRSHSRSRQSLAERNTQVPAPWERQCGQGLLEGLLVLVVLLALWVAMAWVARWQDMALQASHASRFAAFSTTRHPDSLPVDDIRTHFFSGPAHQWADRGGRELLSPGRDEVSLIVNRYRDLSDSAQPGGSARDSVQLRKEWGLEDAGVVSAVVRVAPQALYRTVSGNTDLLKVGLSQFDEHYPILSRHTAILADAGHASNDLSTQSRVASSAFAWSDAANRSYTLGQRVSSVMARVDNAWGRPGPQFDWLSPWKGAVPDRHLDNASRSSNAYFHP